MSTYSKLDSNPALTATYSMLWFKVCNKYPFNPGMQLQGTVDSKVQWLEISDDKFSEARCLEAQEACFFILRTIKGD